jgi:hypothetical protein
MSTFNPEQYMLTLQGKKYLPVAARIAWFRTENPNWTISTKIENIADKGVIMKATVKDDKGNVINTAHKKETQAGFSDYIEKAETGAVGRALAMCGYGTLQAIEFDEGTDRIADAPIERQVEK